MARVPAVAFLALAAGGCAWISGLVWPDDRTALDVAQPVAERVMRYRYHAWHYPQGVTFLGLLYLTEATGDPRYRDYVAAQIENFHATKASWGEPADSDPGYGAKETAPGFRRATREEAERLRICPWCCPPDADGLCRLSVKDDLSVVKVRPKNDNRIQNGVWLELYRQTGDGKFLDWQTKAMARMIEKDPGFKKAPGFQKIIDASFLPGISVARMGAITGDKRYYANAVRRLEAFTDLLRDPKTGIFRQGWGFKTEDPEGYTPGHWGRGNGWIVGAEIETLAFLPKDDPGYEKALALFRDLCASLAKYQDADGMWHQLVADPGSYPETSATGLIVFAYAKGFRLGLLGPEYRDRAIRGFEALKTRVRPDGGVLSTCAGTSPQKAPTLAAYRARPTPLNDPHGDGPVLLAASEILRMEKGASGGGPADGAPAPEEKR